MTEQHRNPVPVEEARIRDLKLHQRWYSRTGEWAFKNELFDEAVLLFKRAGEAQRQLRGIVDGFE